MAVASATDHPPRARVSLALAFAAAAALAGGPAQAASCALNIKSAYQAAKSAGWTFSCKNAVIQFDGAKRPGCFVKTGAQPGVRASGSFFCRDGGLKNGWQFDSIKVGGGQWRGISPGWRCMVNFTFDVNGAFKTGKRHLTEFRLKKNGGNCANAIGEAF